MYELVNTSVPNGLVAGTHGFSTVAMTKGMPDAVRIRVENFCAYPHRVSVRDQRYWKENPVNWFHLTLPGGDHVVGRTAPAEFDYTGRTNRLAHVLYFQFKEMPLNGGAFVLASEELRLSEGWSGAPRYLKEDKTTAERLRMSDSVSGREPSNWIRMFGPHGREYARRFAMLLASNISGAGKSIYFKTSAAQDSDGTQLFGLFSDLINLLPATMTPLATFSTFSACVPSGVTCHLRGVFDRDRAFEAASALQPWVDCETCEVKHAELLPTERVAAPDAKSPTRMATPTAYSTATFAPVGAQRVQNRQPQGRAYAISNKQKGDSSLIWAIAGSVVVILVAVVLILYILQPWKGSRPDPISKPLKGLIDEWQSEQTNKLQRFELELERCTELARLEGLVKEIREAEKDADKTYDNQFGEDFHDEVGSVTRRYKQLVKNADAKMDSLRSKADNGLAKPDTNATQKVTKRKEPAEPKADADVKHVAKPAADEEKKREEEVKASREVALRDLPNLEIVPNDKKWIEELNDEEKKELCKPNSIKYFYFDNGECRAMMGCLEKANIHDPRTKRESVTYSAPLPVEPKSSHWLVVYIPSKQKTYWQWQHDATTQSKIKMFEDGEISKTKLVKLFFGDDDACCLYTKRVKKDIVFEIDPVGVESPYRYYADFEMGGDVLDAFEKTCCEKKRKTIEELNSKVQTAKDEKKACDTVIEKAKGAVELARKKLTEYKKLTKAQREEKVSGDKTRAMQAAEDIKKLLMPYLSETDIISFSCAVMESYIDKVDQNKCACPHPGKHDEAKIESHKGEIDKLNGEIKKEKDKIKSAEYKVKMIGDIKDRGWKKVKR